MVLKLLPMANAQFIPLPKKKENVFIKQFKNILNYLLILIQPALSHPSETASFWSIFSIELWASSFSHPTSSIVILDNKA